MKALQLQRPGPVSTRPLVLTDLPDPRPAAGEVLIEIAACGVCHTDLHLAEGELRAPHYPLVPGHQIVGKIAALGPAVTGLRPGGRVGVPWANRSCGQCPFCRSGRENLCQQALFTGFSAPGGFAEQVAVPAECAYPLSAGRPAAELAPLLCAGVIGLRTLRVAEVKAGETVGLIGFGASAHLVLQIARHWGCEVFVFTRGQSRRRLALDLGAAWAGGIEEEPPRRPRRLLFFAPAGSLLPRALELLERGGTLAVASIHLDGGVPPLDYARHLYHEKTLRSVANSTRQDVSDLLALAGEIPLQSRVQIFPLAQANEALQQLKEGRLSGAAAVLTI